MLFITNVSNKAKFPKDKTSWSIFAQKNHLIVVKFYGFVGDIDFEYKKINDLSEIAGFKDIHNGKVVDNRLYTEYKKESYELAREKAYPSITEQLDMLFWDTKNNTTNWEDLISSIKKTFPKK